MVIRNEDRERWSGHGSLAPSNNNQTLSLSSVEPRVGVIKRCGQNIQEVRKQPRLMTHLVLTVGVGIVVIAAGLNITQANQEPTQTSLKVAEETGFGGPVDDTASAYIAADVATQLELPVTQEVQAKVERLENQPVATGDDQAIVKPQVITANSANRGIQVYLVQAGDTIASVAQKHGITTDTVAWANDLTGGAQLLPNTELRILPVNGVLYTARAGDTPASVADTFKANAEQIISFNDLEVGGLQPGAQIIVPGGVKPAAAPVNTAAITSAVSSVSGTPFTPVYGSNGYDYGYCTWYAANRRSNNRPVPSNWGNAISWYNSAANSGYRVGAAPQVGAVAWDKTVGYLGHVAYVEEVNGDQVRVSEMNYNGWGVVSSRWTDASHWRYIY